MCDLIQNSDKNSDSPVVTQKKKKHKTKKQQDKKNITSSLSLSFHVHSRFIHYLFLHPPPLLTRFSLFVHVLLLNSVWTAWIRLIIAWFWSSLINYYYLYYYYASYTRINVLFYCTVCFMCTPQNGKSIFFPPFSLFPWDSSCCRKHVFVLLFELTRRRKMMRGRELQLLLPYTHYYIDYWLRAIRSLYLKEVTCWRWERLQWHAL